jgi:crossover junction endodeoxyribonuclease RusA
VIEAATIKFHPPTHPLSINESNKMHWATRRRRLEPWKRASTIAWRAQVPFWTLGPVLVSVQLPFDRGARRDAHNYTSTVVKSIVDGLVDAGMCPDDTPEWVEVSDPTLYVERDGLVVVSVLRRDA